MAEIDQKDYYISPTMRFVDAEGRLTKQGFDLVKAASQIIEAVHLVPGEVGPDELADLAVTAAKLDDNAVVIGKIAAGAIYVDTLFANQVITTGKVADEAITVADAVTTDGTINVSDTDGLTIVQSAVINPVGGKIIVTGYVELGEDYSTGTVGLYKDATLVVSRSWNNTAAVAPWVPRVLLYVDNSPSNATWSIKVHQTTAARSIDVRARSLQWMNAKK